MPRWNPIQTQQRFDDYVKKEKGKTHSAFEAVSKPIEVSCIKGHHFKITPRAALNRKRWCRICKNQANNSKKRWSPDKLRKAGDLIGCDLITKDYKHAHQQLEWKCQSKGHSFKRSISDLKVLRLCPLCKKTDSLRQVAKRLEKQTKAICSEKGGKLIEIIPPKRRGEHWKARVACAQGHVSAKGCHELKISWCQKCHLKKMVDKREYNKRLNLKIFQLIARDKGGECRSKEYLGTEEKLKFTCSEGHAFELKAGHVRSGHWCPICSSQTTARKKRMPIADIQEEARKRGGECLDKAYDDAKKKLTWKCSESSHPTWEAKWDKIKSGQWCPECSSGFGERVVRLFFNRLFDKPFPKERPKWLKGPKLPLELDGYNKELLLAFEHHGAQHYEVDGRFSESEADLENQKIRDVMKLDLCEKHGVKLIVIPEIKSILPLPQVKEYILNELNKSGVLIPKVNLSKLFRDSWWYPAYAGESKSWRSSRKRKT